MELKRTKAKTQKRHVRRSNRTFMELKQRYLNMDGLLAIGSNRTFMELKLA